LHIRLYVTPLRVIAGRTKRSSGLTIAFADASAISLNTLRIANHSSLRKLPLPISERHIMLLDGIRYSADMAAMRIALGRHGGYVRR
jgi:hypothetical protein